MAIYAEIGYLEADYLVDPYFQGTAFFGTLMQIDRRVDDSKPVDMQALRQVDKPQSLASQVLRELTKQKTILAEVDRVFQGEEKQINVEVDRLISSVVKAIDFEVSRGGLLQGGCSHTGYLLAGYLTEPYATEFICVRLPMQVSRKPRVEIVTNAQVSREITTTKALKSQAERRIDKTKTVKFQVEARKSKTILMQVRKVLYNTFNIRVLWDFPSRGNGNNWTLPTGTAAAGDFGPNNLNTDIVEQVFRSTSASSVVLACDTGISNGVFVDTIGILNHNLTNSAVIQVEGSQSPSFNNTVTYALKSDGTNNIIWIKPTVALQSYRYWRFSFADNSNPDGYIQIGAIVFGSASIFQGENIVDTIVKTQKHFADKVATEGFTTVSNDRTVKTSVSLEFRNLSYGRENYEMLTKIFDYCRTSLKALWIPTPRSPTRFGVFGKLASLPSEQHESYGAEADYVSFSIEVDESL